MCLDIFHFSTFYFLRYAQVKNQKGAKKFIDDYENKKSAVKLRW